MLGASFLTFLGKVAADLSAGGASSRTPKTIVSNGGAAISTTTSEFGVSSIYFDGTDDYLTSSDQADWTLGNGPFTVEFWMNTSDTTSEIIGQQGYQTYKGWSIGVRSSQRVLLAAGDNNANSISVLVGATSSFTESAWTHVALTKNSSGATAIFVDGTRAYYIGSWPHEITDPGTTNLQIGRGWGVSTTFSGGGTEGYYYTGYLDEIRISDTNRYDPTSSTITVPTAAFENDENTLLLIHGDGTNGSTTITDDGGPQ
jgi:hypothetical protein